MAENTKEELEKMAKEKAEAAKKAASKAAEKLKNISADEAKEIAKEKASQAKKAAAEAAEKLKNMSADEAKELAKEKLESMKSLDNSAKLKYGGIAILVLLVVVYLFSGSSGSSNEDFLKDRVAKKGMIISDFNIESEDDIEVFGHKGTQAVITVTYKAEEGKVLCQYDFLRDYHDKIEKDSISVVNTEAECKRLRYSNGKVTNQKVVPSAEKIRTVVFGKSDVLKWEKKNS